ncbi:MAG: sigma-54-dependent Fis family transcriptional regulator [Myxococcales bacterium]|nr:sigma-54-dependent Fis family transcriptional regulator [Myxococcales bacterium]
MTRARLDPRLVQGVNVVVVDDDPSSLQIVVELLRVLGFSRVEAASGGAAGLELIAEIQPQLVITDLMMPEIDGAQLLEQVKRENPTIRVIVMSVLDSVPQAVRMLKSGADDYLTKPVALDVLRARLDALLVQVSVAREARELRDLIENTLRGPTSFVWGTSPAMMQVAARLPSLARTDAAVLVHGESGTGKEVIARTIHYASSRASGPMISVSCASIPDGLWEREFFGHTKGAFSDSGDGAPGVAAAADGGTLFLDEVGEIPLAMQAKLLRFLQEKEYRPVGATTPRKADVRIVSATNRDLAAEVEAGRFRQDLYYRLNVLPLAVPPLRERKEDVPLLASYFLKRYAREFGREVVALSVRAVQKLCSYDFPGNVRELENVVQQALVGARRSVIHADEIPVGDVAIVERDVLPEPAPMATGLLDGGSEDDDGDNDSDNGHFVSAGGRVVDEGEGGAGDEASFVDTDVPYNEAKAEAIERFERGYIEAMLTQHDGNVARAARAAGLPRKSFARIMKRHEIGAGPDGQGGRPGRPRKDAGEERV